MAGAYQGGQELIGIGCLLLLRLSRLTSCCLMIIGVGIGIALFGELFSANCFPRRGVSCRSDSGSVCRRLLSLVILDILASRPSPSLAAVDIHGVYCVVITRYPVEVHRSSAQKLRVILGLRPPQLSRSIARSSQGV